MTASKAVGERQVVPTTLLSERRDSKTGRPRSGDLARREERKGELEGVSFSRLLEGGAVISPPWTRAGRKGCLQQDEKKKIWFNTADGGRRDGQDIIETIATTQKAVAEGRIERVRDKRQKIREKQQVKSLISPTMPLVPLGKENWQVG